ncbi:DUF6979 family protein [Celerinatantimonas diazotrophica]|uniref:Uncharacterized protein n=1 Tax=Celerinatantimonas diazotrophica TaxID=412034 RepID=A0A4R1K2C4_9GAMM|nr:hypothetical protein [Celerinatantimonas diazotrophica]TCK58080.1 hypothetical protein EV690_1787 [Celerinatantimonas diazotrophica]CAG9297848.1 hypothetical protein CEDIAZO_03040 [Celerinatantimonas diazotrophica]
MSRYGLVALEAAEIAQKHVDANIAWTKAAEHQFGKKTSLIKKGCPKGTFLGLAEDGHIKGIPSGHYTSSTKNKAYGLAALQQLKMSPELAKNKKGLWFQSCNDQPKVQNNQMDVVIALWENNLLI